MTRITSMLARGLVALALAALSVPASPARAMTIEQVVSPAGIAFWLVREPAVPLIALNYAFVGGASQDAADKAGTANMTADLLDEGAGDLDSRAFHERLENRAIELGFSVGRDYIYGTLRMQTENRDEAFDLLRLALNAPRFDADAVERVRGQLMSGLRRDTMSPNALASRRWWETAFPGHAYGRESKGSLESVPRVTVDDLRGYTKHVFARDTLKIALVGDIDAKTAGDMIDRAFSTLPAKADVVTPPLTTPRGLGRRIVVDIDVPQAVVAFGAPGLARADPDFLAGYIVNHILGGGSFSSRLYTEVREKRGLAYGVSDSLLWFNQSSVFIGGTATRADRTGDALTVIEQEIARMAKDGPTEDELEKAKSYLKGSYALGLDTSSKIAGALVQIQLDKLGIDYMARRDALIDAVTLEDTRRAAKRLLSGGMLVTVAGRPKGVASVGE